VTTVLPRLLSRADLELPSPNRFLVTEYGLIFGYAGEHEMGILDHSLNCILRLNDELQITAFELLKKPSQMETFKMAGNFARADQTAVALVVANQEDCDVQFSSEISFDQSKDAVRIVFSDQEAATSVRYSEGAILGLSEEMELLHVHLDLKFWRTFNTK
jgi:hypothetical protein